jgi:glutamine amidotransferase
MGQLNNHIAVLDYGMGNLHSVAKALQHVDSTASVSVTADAAVVASADRVVFPGVGAIRDCMAEIRRLKLDEVVRQAIVEKPVLSICVGMQVLLQHSEENGGVEGLGFLPGKVKLFDQQQRDDCGDRLKVPHMGWNAVHQVVDHPLWQGIEQHSQFYFVHSYYVETPNRQQIAGYCDYGVNFAAALTAGNLFAVQFHPEKSADAGLRLLKNFTQWSV